MDNNYEVCGPHIFFPGNAEHAVKIVPAGEIFVVRTFFFSTYGNAKALSVLALLVVIMITLCNNDNTML